MLNEIERIYCVVILSLRENMAVKHWVLAWHKLIEYIYVGLLPHFSSYLLLLLLNIILTLHYYTITTNTATTTTTTTTTTLLYHTITNYYTTTATTLLLPPPTQLQLLLLYHFNLTVSVQTIVTFPFYSLLAPSNVCFLLPLFYCFHRILNGRFTVFWVRSQNCEK